MNDLENKHQQLRAKERQLDSAQRTLDELEVQAAGIPLTERSPVFSRSLTETREKVETLKAEIQEIQAEIQGLEGETHQTAAGRPRKQPRPKPQPYHIPFQNREDEIRAIQSSFAPPYFLLDAPAGYGKSVLLEQLAKRFKEDNWLVAHVRLDEQSSVQGLVAELAQTLEMKCPPTSPDLVHCAAQLARILLDDKGNKMTQEGLVFLIDLDQEPALSMFEQLLRDFIPTAQESLRVHEFFQAKHNRLRVILAGRYLAGRVRSASGGIPLTVLRLAPFNYTVIRDTIQILFPNYATKSIVQIAAHAMYLTGGHPGCIAHCLASYQSSGLPPDVFLRVWSDKVWQEHVRPTVYNIRDNTPESLQKALDRVSVFRYLDYPLLDILTAGEAPLIEGYESGSDLADRLTGAYLSSWQRRLLRDDITRRLLVIRSSKEEEDFSSWCRQAQEMCAAHLRRPRTQLPEVWAIEYLYQVLQEYAGAVREPRQRQVARDRFNKEVPQALTWLLDGRDPREQHQALNEALEEDWEFRFTVNYFLREDRYSDRPYQQLLRQTEKRFSAHLTGEEQKK